MRHYSRLLLIALPFVFLGLSTVASADPYMYPLETQVLLYSRAKLTAKEQNTLTWLKSGEGFFGAMAINPAAEHAFAVKNYHNFQDALLAAIKGCQITSPSSPDQCVLYAALTPAGFSGSQSDPNGISQHAEVYFKTKYLQSQVKGKYGAFAISGLADVGAVWGRTSKAEADDAALQYCKASVDRTMGSFNIAGRQAVQKAKLDACKIVDSRSG